MFRYIFNVDFTLSFLDRVGLYCRGTENAVYEKNRGGGLTCRAHHGSGRSWANARRSRISHDIQTVTTAAIAERHQGAFVCRIQVIK